MGNWTFGLLVLLGIVLLWALMMLKIAKEQGIR